MSFTTPVDPCAYPECREPFAHHHTTMAAPNGEVVQVIVMHLDIHPRAEVRDSETGEVIFPAVKGPLQVIEGGKP